LADWLRRIWVRFRALRKHHQVAIILGAIAVVVVIAVILTPVVRQPDEGIDTAGPRIAPPLETRLFLAERFAPVLKMDSRELLLPIGVDTYVSATTLDERRGAALRVLQAKPTLASLPISNGDCVVASRCMFQLDVQGAEPHSDPRKYGAINRALLDGGARLTVYANVVQYTNTGNYAVQYWFLYLFNYRLNQHESDWEQITVMLDKDQNPMTALYSSHATGFTRNWSEMEHDGYHPIVYVAQGSHANYFHAGTHDVTIFCRKLFKRFGVCVRKRDIRDKSNGIGTELIPDISYDLSELTTPLYVGSYGTGNYVGGHRANDLLSDPRLRGAWRNPLARLIRGVELKGAY
jgi:hypothetical protein